MKKQSFLRYVFWYNFSKYKEQKSSHPYREAYSKTAKQGYKNGCRYNGYSNIYKLVTNVNRNKQFSRLFKQVVDQEPPTAFFIF